MSRVRPLHREKHDIERVQQDTDPAPPSRGKKSRSIGERGGRQARDGVVHVGEVQLAEEEQVQVGVGVDFPGGATAFRPQEGVGRGQRYCLAKHAGLCRVRCRVCHHCAIICFRRHRREEHGLRARPPQPGDGHRSQAAAVRALVPADAVASVRADLDVPAHAVAPAGASHQANAPVEDEREERRNSRWS